jgi:hypothetical protein
MHAREEDDAAPFDLNWTATYRFGQVRPGQADESGPAWLGSAASARFFFSSYPVISFYKSLLDSKICRNIFVSQKLVIQISMCS